MRHAQRAGCLTLRRRRRCGWQRALSDQDRDEAFFLEGTARQIKCLPVRRMDLVRNVIVTEILPASNAELSDEMPIQPHNCPRVFPTFRDFGVEFCCDGVGLSLGQ